MNIIEEEQMINETIIFECNNCNYKTSNKSDYNRHNLSSKHIEKKRSKNIEIFKYNCLCGKSYKGRDGLWRHKKKCTQVLQNEYDYRKTVNENKPDIELWKDMVETLVIQNNEWQNKYTELQDKLMEETKEFRDTIVNMKSNNTTNINTLNNTFNLQIFLNETCKDAMNIDEFIDSIEISIEDLKHLGKIGYVEGISDLFMKNLEELDITKRPLHCSDMKRETVYIRDKNLWTKENDQKVRLTKVATDIVRLNTIALQNKYQEMYPNCLTDVKSNEHKEYGKIAYEAFGGLLDIEKANKKLFRNIMKIVAINKNNFV